MMAKNIYLFLLAINSGCTLLNEPETFNYNTEKVLFEMCDTIKHNYSYLSFKQINIDSIYSFYSSKLTNYKGDRIFNLINDVLYELMDGHVSFYTNGGFQIQPYIPRRMLKDKYAYDPIVIRKYFNNPLELTGDNKIEYGILDNNLGYIYLSTMKRGNTDWILSFSSILSKLMNTDSIILDVRDNGGGSDIITQYIIRLFLTEPIETPIWIDAQGNELKRSLLNPLNKNTYKGKIIILQNGTNFSATEGFLNVMRELPNVTTIGDTTGGGSGDPQNFNLSDNLAIRLSTKMQLTYQRKQIEWNGIEPDILIQQTKEDLDNGRDLQLEAAIKYLSNLIMN